MRRVRAEPAIDPAPARPRKKRRERHTSDTYWTPRQQRTSIKHGCKLGFRGGLRGRTVPWRAVPRCAWRKSVSLYVWLYVPHDTASNRKNADDSCKRRPARPVRGGLRARTAPAHLGELLPRVVGDDVSDLVPEHGSQSILVRGGPEQPREDHHLSPRVTIRRARFHPEMDGMVHQSEK